jgi:hypothetical protein
MDHGLIRAWPRNNVVHCCHHRPHPSPDHPQGNTARHYSVSHANWDVVALLLDTDICQVDAPNRVGYTPVMLAALTPIQTDSDRAVVSRLFQEGDVNHRAAEVREGGWGGVEEEGEWRERGWRGKNDGGGETLQGRSSYQTLVWLMFEVHVQGSKLIFEMGN